MKEKIYIRDHRSPIPKDETTSKIMSAIKGKDTKPELILRKALWNAGLKGYRLHWKKVIGKPDIVFVSKKIAIFCDSEFWHGKEYLEGRIPKNNTEYWVKKFKRNIARDQQVNKELENLGWIVLRFWEKDIRNHLTECIELIRNTIESN